MCSIKWLKASLPEIKILENSFSLYGRLQEWVKMVAYTRPSLKSLWTILRLKNSDPLSLKTLRTQRSKPCSKTFHKTSLPNTKYRHATSNLKTFKTSLRKRTFLQSYSKSKKSTSISLQSTALPKQNLCSFGKTSTTQSTTTAYLISWTQTLKEF